MIADIYQKMEDKLVAAEYFDGFNFFRSDSDKSQGKQNKGKAPYLRLVFLREDQRSARNRVHMEKTARFRLDVVTTTSATDKDDFARVTQVQDIVQAVSTALLTPADNDFLELVAVKDLRVASTYENMGDISKVELQVLSFEIEVDYIKRL